ncbi:elongation of very long chain fatty acids protein 6-like [Asterias rubens]|uniref:elongation of very long chain fatty acids protein 6-like n=1 Tax=Asterias rubens TaxID=7604 RepID=UPI00145507CF|nr:elongation of very long chain fatty acids protein 6-like [Asterias rubens]
MSETRGFPPVTLPLQVPLNTTKVPVVYAYEFAFERRFDHEWGVGLFQQYWSVGIPLCSLYVLLILVGQRIMRDRPAYDLRQALTAWSVGLAIFSWIGLLRGWEESYYMATTYGPKSIACDSVGFIGASGLWAWLFAASKLVELGDTAFIVLRKQKLIFLHWYHHITVLLYTWYSYGCYTSTGRCFLVMNYTVHAFMYTYYALKASRLVRIPRKVNVCITILQIMQMFMGIIINLYAHQVLKSGEPCDVTWRNLEVSFVMYLSYFMLFANYFYRAYFAKQQEKLADKSDMQQPRGQLNNGEKKTN